MEIESVTSLIVLGVLLVIFLGLAFRHRGVNPRLPSRPIRTPPAVQLEKLRISGRFRGVKIESNCQASAHLIGHEYEFDNTPNLPSPGCVSEVCECGYVGLPERRHSPDRRGWSDRRASPRPGSRDRRSKSPRRKADLAAWAAQGRL